MVLRLALSDARKLDSKVFDKIVGGATFGDPAGRPKSSPAAIPFAPNMVAPPFARELNSKVIVNCAQGDPVKTSHLLDSRVHFYVMNVSLTDVE